VSWEYGNRFSKFMLRRLTIRVPSGWIPEKHMSKIFCSNLSRRCKFSHMLMNHQGTPVVPIGELVDKLTDTRGRRL
jgi:hypothetical protein